jgi:hypothetical protein
VDGLRVVGEQLLAPAVVQQGGEQLGQFAEAGRGRDREVDVREVAAEFVEVLA